MKKFAGKLLLGFAVMVALFGVVACQSSSAGSGGLIPSSSVKKRISSTVFTSHGFKLIEQKSITMVGGTAYILEHIKSGAQIHYVDIDDENLSFSITVSTPPELDNGANHILEHMTLASTSLYPGKEVFYGAMNTTLNTYMNASTSATYIQFPFSTTEEKQFVSLADYYLSAVFEPTLNEYVFKREGWRYELNTSSDTLTINGIVFNEIKANGSNILRELTGAVRESLFPDTVVKNDSAGKPASIPTLTIEDLRAYHKKYFIPSNTIISLYGDLDIDAFLQFLDENWLSRYEKASSLVQIPSQTAFEKPKYMYRNFPAPASFIAENHAAISKGYAISGLGEKDIPALLLMVNILNNQNSPLMKTLNASGIADSYFLTLNFATRQPQFEIIAQNINPGKASTFEKLIDNAFLSFAENGVDTELFDSVKADFYAGGILAREDTGIGLTILSSMSVGQIAMGVKYALATANYDVQNTTMIDVKNCIKKYLVQNTHSVLVILDPKPGMGEEQENTERARLEKIKKSMSHDQINALVSETVAFNTWLASPDEKGTESVSKLQVLKPENLTKTPHKHVISDTQRNGVRYIHTPVSGNALRTTLLLNVSQLTPEELLYAKLYTQLIGEIGAGTMSEEQIDYKLSMLILGMSSSVETFFTDYQCSDSYPVINYSWFSEHKNTQKAEELMSTILYDTVLDPNRLKVLIAMMKAQEDRKLQSQALSYATLKAEAAASYSYVLQDYLSGLPYYSFIQNVYKDVNKNPSPTIEKILSVRDKMLVRNEPIILTAGSSSVTAGNDICSKLAAYEGSLDHSYSKVSQPAARQAVIIKDTVNYVAAAQRIPFDKQMDFTFAADILSNEYYTPKIRLSGGAYGGGAEVDRIVYVAYCLRDPNPDTTISVFNNASKALKSVSGAAWTAQNIEPYIIARYGMQTEPQGVYTAAYISEINYLRNYTPEMELKILGTLKAITPQTVVSTIQSVDTGSIYTVFLNESAYKASSLVFDTVIDLTNAGE